MTKLNYEFWRPSDPAKFEELCKDLWAEEWKYTNTALHGRRGQTQLGVDVFGIDKSKDAKNKKYSGIQSKKRAGSLFGKQDLTEAELKKEVADAQKFDEGELEQLIIATTLDDDTKYQALARKLTKSSKFDVSIVGWQTISSLLSKYPEIAKNYYPLPPSSDDPQFQIFKSVAISSTNQQLNQAKELIDEGNPGSALKILQKLENNGANALDKEDQFKLYTNTAVAYSNLGDSNDKVIQYFEKAYALGIDKPASYHNMAAVYLYRGQLDEAARTVDEGLKRHSTPSLKALRAKISYQLSKNADEVIKTYADEAKKESEVAYHLATIASDGELRSEAIGLLKSHVEAAKKEQSFDSAQLLALYGSLLVEDITAKNNYLLGHFDDESLQQVKEAKDVLDVVANILAGKQVEKLFSDIFTRRSVLNQILGDKVGAIADAKKAYDLTPNNPQVAGHYAMILMDEGKFDDAHKTLQIENPDGRRLKLLDAVIYNRQGLKEEHLKILESLVGDQTGLSNHDRFVAYCAYVQALLDYNDLSKAKEAIKQFENLMGTTAESLEYQAVIAAKEGNEGLAVDYLIKAVSAINQMTLRETIATVGSRLHDHKRHSEAISALKKVVTINTYDLFLQKYLLSLWYERQFEIAERLCREVIEKHGNKPLCIEILFNIYIEKNDLQGAVKLLEDIAGELTANEYALKLASLNAQMDNTEKAKEVIASIDLSTLTDDELVNAAEVLKATDQAFKAVKLLYPAILKSPSNPQLQMAYIITLLTTGVDIDDPSKVVEDTTVEVSSIDGAQHRTITIESDRAQEDLSRNHYHIDHAAAKQILGKVQGDEVQLGQNDKYEIKLIKSKYIHLLHDLMNNFPERFPDIHFLQRVKVIEDNGDLNLDEMSKILNQTAEQGQKITALIEKGTFPMAAASKVYKHSFVDMYYAFIYDQERILPSSIFGDPTISKLPSTVILDLTACITLCESGIRLPRIEGVKYVMPSSSLSSIDEKLKELNSPKAKDGYAVAYSDKGQVRFQERPKEVVEANKKVLNNLLDWIKSNVETIPLTKPEALPKAQYEKLEAVIAKEGLDVMVEAAAQAQDVIVISNDFALRRLMGSEQPDVKTANTQQFIKHIRELGKITANDYENHTKFLLGHGFKHTFIEISDLITAIKANNLRPDDDFDLLLTALKDERTDIKPVIGVAIRFLYEYWKLPGSQLHWTAVLPTVLENLRQRDDYKQNEALLDAVILRVFRMLPQVANEVIQAKKILDIS